jgi:hypothetical protein
MANMSLQTRFEELQAFKNIFGFLLSSTILKSSDDTQLRDCCNIFAETFSSDGSSNVVLN